jgi:hypothetical protein
LGEFNGHIKSIDINFIRLFETVIAL